MAEAPHTGLAARIAPLGRRLLGRHARLLRATGYSMGHAVAERHEPPAPARAARRLAPVRLVSRSGPPGRAPSSGSGLGPGSTEPAWQPSATESTVLPGVSDWAAEYLFGDATSAVSSGDAWLGGAGLTPRSPEERRVSRAKRGAADVARETKILEGDERPPAPPDPERLARPRPTPPPPHAPAPDPPLS